MVQVSRMSDLATGDTTWLNELNLQQRRAATHGSGPLLVVAGAGTGKTRTIAYRVAHLLSEGVQPERILLLTFTRRAAEEMRVLLMPIHLFLSQSSIQQPGSRAPP
jgi:ATP-dependent exoDNAse (exonuclease V) beta subunit